MRRIKTTLPLLTCLIHGQLRPPFALSSKEKSGMFPKLKVQMEQLLIKPDLEKIDLWYSESLPHFSNLQFEEVDLNESDNALLRLFKEDDESYNPATIPDVLPLMDIEITIPNAFASLFYDVALRLETKRTLLWLKKEDERLQNGDAMLQMIRDVLTRLNEFSHECILRQKKSTDNCNEIIKLRIMQLYFAIELIYCKHYEWRVYLEDVCKLPLNLDEYCYRLWEGTPDLEWRKAYDNLMRKQEEDEMPALPILTEGPKLTTSAETFAGIVAPFCFVELPLVKALNAKQQAELIELIVKDKCFAAAMLEYLGYYNRLKDVYQKNQTNIIKHCSEALGCSTSTYKKYYYSLKADNPYVTYQNHNSKAYLENKQVEKDYSRISQS